MENMTALVSAFARAYHERSGDVWVFRDQLAGKLLTREEYEGIARSMTDGAQYFLPGFSRPRDEALRLIVNRHLAPAVLARSAFCERAAAAALLCGVRQYVQFGCGYDTFSLRTGHADLTVYELDRPDMIRDRQRRIARAGLRPVCHAAAAGCDLSRPSWTEELLRAGFRTGSPAFGSLLGLSYYLTKEEWAGLLRAVSSVWSPRSSLCFDYPLVRDGAESGRNRALAAAAGERMKASYTYEEMEALLSEAGFLIYEHLTAAEAADAFFTGYNRAYPDAPMAVPEEFGCCLAVKWSGTAENG